MSELSTIVPGPSPDGGRPPPPQIDCVEVRRVYDSCFQTETRDNVCLRMPESCGPAHPGTVAAGTVSGVDCRVEAVTPIANSGGFANVTLLLAVTVEIALARPDATRICAFCETFRFLKTVTLCAPAGVSVRCEAPAAAVDTALILDREVCTVVSLCLLIQSWALVELLVPSYGFCLPAPCAVQPSPPFACPPSPLFPERCGIVAPAQTPAATPAATPCPPWGGARR